MKPRNPLFVPADSERKVTKAYASEADAVILDLEDSIAPSAEPAARSAAAARLASDTCCGLHLSAVGRDLIGLNRLTLAGIIGCVWLTLGDFWAYDRCDGLALTGLRIPMDRSRVLRSKAAGTSDGSQPLIPTHSSHP